MGKRMIDVNEYANDIVKALKGGILLTAKAGEKVNSMVIGWGTLGVNWSHPVFAVYVREGRFTRELLDSNPEFTVNVPINGFDKNAFRICGTQSGRKMDKIAEAGLTPVDSEVITVPGIREFPLTLECRVLYKEEQDASKLPEDIRKQFYSIQTSDHTAFYGEIVAAYIIE